ncbi:MAG: diadenylate cyclase CdaA [Candidatus Cloacimonetes bacterium]|nr:diadenylate cyclase CdaA [Candidatus Cloacimonadota bacterium]
MSFLIPGIKDIVDILLVAAILFRVLATVQRRGGVQVLIGLALILLLYFVSALLDLKLMTSLFQLVRNYWLLAFVVLFQPELRNMINRMGRHSGLKSMFSPRKKYIYSPLLEAVTSMSFRKTGALILIENRQNLDEYIATGETIDALLTSKLLLTIFNRRTILHDGAAVLRGNRIFAVKALLRLSRNVEYVQKFGTRHLAAIGVTEETDCLAVVVSEETGRISAAQNGSIFTDLSTEELAQIIADATR